MESNIPKEATATFFVAGSGYPGLQRSRGGEILFPESESTGLGTETSSTAFVMLYWRDISTLVKTLDEALSQIRELRKELSQRPLTSSISLYDLGTDRISVKLPISITIQETDEESMARWPEVRAYGVANTVSEAIFDLKKNILSLFFDLASRPADALGEIALDTLRILKIHLESVK